MKLDSLNGYFYEDRFQVGKSRDFFSLKQKAKNNLAQVIFFQASLEFLGKNNQNNKYVLNCKFASLWDR